MLLTGVCAVTCSGVCIGSQLMKIIEIIVGFTCDHIYVVLSPVMKLVMNCNLEMLI